ncbi:ABC transporter permease [Spirosoma rhododendri]|uniref:FtsX-like permease family protein n=1 Tax=Spirosoma rhododendri TaxID=2728024 RepID=A0A7L5DJM9_9BACT|nr:ABC transporter permease [Spirosoma rhododendri]QJD78649.1 FtsX-like permease family protein [Spirosoma rhododendri]
MFRNHLKIAVRALWKNKLFSGLNIVGLGVGMAAVWLMVLYVVNERSYDRFHANADRIVRVVQHAQWQGGNLNIAATPAPFAEALKQDYPEVEKTVRFNQEGGGLITVGDKKLDVPAIFFTDPTVFDVFTFPFLYGDPHTALRGPQRIVLTKSVAEKLFGTASNAVGKVIEFSNHFPNTVTGVIEDVPTNSHLQFGALRSLPDNYTSGWQQAELFTYLLLAKGSEPESLSAKLGGFFSKYLKKEMGDVTYRLELQPLSSIHLHSHLDYEISANGNARTVSIFAAVAALILLIACINYINLNTVRALKRTREVGVRKAVGSFRLQLIGQFLTESLLMTLLAGLVSASLVVMALPYFNRLADKALSLGNWADIMLTVVLFSVLIGTLSGLYPALRMSGFRPVPALRGQQSTHQQPVRLRQALVVFQFVATVALIACSGIVYRQMQFVRQADLGFNKEQVLTFHIDDEAVRQRVDALKEALLRNPLIESAAAASNPIGNNNIGGSGMFFEQQGAFGANAQLVQKFLVDPDYLTTLEIGLVSGRNFSESFKSDASNAVLINQTLARQLGPRPVGKRVRYVIDQANHTAEARIVGVVKDFHTYSLQHKVEPLVLQMPTASDKDNLYVRIRAGNVSAALAYIQTVYRTFSPTATLDFHFLDENFSKQYQAEQKQGDVLLTFTVLAVFIACLGLFGLVAFAAEQRTKEIGVRKVLGASVASIVGLLSRDFLKLVLIAVIIASPLAWYAMHRWLQNFAYKIDLAWWLFALAGLLTTGIALLTVSFQSIRAALVNPVKSLRSE